MMRTSGLHKVRLAGKARCPFPPHPLAPRPEGGVCDQGVQAPPGPGGGFALVLWVPTMSFAKCWLLERTCLTPGAALRPWGSCSRLHLAVICYAPL